MANTLTGLIQTVYSALDIISRELVGFIPAVSINASADKVAKNQIISIPVVPATGANVDIVPAVTAPDSGDEAIGHIDMKITKSKMQPVRWTGEEQKSLEAGGIYPTILRDRFAQAMRSLVNEVEADLAAAAYVAGSRAWGTAGTAPFASDLEPAAQIRKILDDNGAPPEERTLIINTLAGVNLRKLTSLISASAAGTDATLRQGTLLSLFGLDIKESAQVQGHTKGTGAGYLVDLIAGYNIGDTEIHVDTGTGTILAGDVITFAGDTNKYVVVTGFAGDGDGDIVIGKPGLRKSLANNVALTIGDSFSANIGFQKQALQLLARVPQMPIEGDQADDVITITDPLTGISFQLALYKQYRQVHYEVGLAWGVEDIKSEHTTILLG